IYTKINGVYYSGTDITFTAANSPHCKSTLSQPAGLVPQPTSALPSVDLTNGFAWTAVPNATAYYLYVGTTVGDKDLANSGEIAQTTYVPMDLPTDGRTLYVRVWTRAGFWRYLDYTLTASESPQRATFTAPANSATNVDLTQALQWTTLANTQAYYLKIGTTVGGLQHRQQRRDSADVVLALQHCGGPAAVRADSDEIWRHLVLQRHHLHPFDG